MKLYRYERYYTFDDDGYISDYGIRCTEYNVFKETPRGYWIRFGMKDKFVLKGARKRFAYETKEEAFNSFRIRTQKSISYCKSHLRNAKEILKLIELESMKLVTDVNKEG